MAIGDVDRLTATAYTVPTDQPESDGTLAWDRTTILVVELFADDLCGLGYSYTSAAAGHVVIDQLAHEFEQFDWATWRAMPGRMRSAVRNVGQSGIAASAIAAVDIALWDLRARALGVSLLDLIGPVRDEIAAYGSGGFTSYSINQLTHQLSGWAEQGFRMVKMKIGRQPDQDLARVRAARKAIGPDVRLFVDANGAFDRTAALQAACWLDDMGVSWFEEPLVAADLAGLRLVRSRLPAGMELAGGEYAWQPADSAQLIEAGAIDVLQIDGTRCLGVSGFLAGAQIAAPNNVPVSAHTAPTLHATLCCAVEGARHAEYFHDHVRIEQLFFDGALAATNGMLRPRRDVPGLGLSLRQPDAAPYLVWQGQWHS